MHRDTGIPKASIIAVLCSVSSVSFESSECIWFTYIKTDTTEAARAIVPGKRFRLDDSLVISVFNSAAILPFITLNPPMEAREPILYFLLFFVPICTKR